MARLFPVGVLIVALAISASGQEQALCDLGTVTFTAQKANVKVVEALEAALLEIQATGTEGFPGVWISAPEGTWNLAAFGQVAATVTNAGSGAMTVALRVDNEGDWRQEPWSVSQLKIGPGETQAITTVLGKANGKAKAGFDSSAITKIGVFVVRGKGEVDLRLNELRAEGKPVAVVAEPAASVEPVTPVRILVEPSSPEFDLAARVRLQDVEATAAEKTLTLTFGTVSNYPTAVFRSADGPWNLTGYEGVEAEVTNLSQAPITLAMRVDNQGANGRDHCNTETVSLAPGKARTIGVKFGQSWGKAGFPLDPAKVVGILLFTTRNRDAKAIQVGQVRAMQSIHVEAAPGKATTAKPAPPRVTVDYPAVLEFEPPHELFDLDGGEITAESAEVISGEHSLVGDSRGKGRKWFEFATTRPGVFKPGYTYTVTFRYRVIQAGEDAKFYGLFRSLSQGWGRWDRGWKDQSLAASGPGQILTGSLTTGLAIHDDYQLMFGINGEARIVIDDVRIEQGEPFAEPDPEHDKINAIPETAEAVLSCGFETPTSDILVSRPESLVAGELALAGETSLLMDSRQDKGDWNVRLGVKPDNLPGGYRYHLYLRSRAVSWDNSAAYAYIVVKQARVKDGKDLVWKRWRGVPGSLVWVYTAFEVPAGESASLNIGIYKQGQALIDDLVIRREPLAVKAIASREPLARSEANLVWSDEFNGTSIDTRKWKIYHEPRRGGWWNPDDAVLDGQGNLALRFRKYDDTFSMGAIHTNGIFSFTYGYVEARMKLPTQPGHWPGIWLMGNSVGNVGDDGRDGTEVDIVECPWQKKDLASHALHWDGYGLDHQAAGHKAEVPGLHEGWHTFAVDWSPAGYIFFVDGKETWRTDAGGVCRNPLYIILSEEMGGWSGNPREATELPDQTLIDYIRVWQDKPAD